MRIFKSIVIGDRYLQRWYLIPRNPILNVYLHRFEGSDDDRALHDHPWHSLSILLKGRLREYVFSNALPPGKMIEIRHPSRFLPVFRRATHAHRLELIQGPAWTIFITGPRFRQWGFHCPNGWRHWRNFTDASGLRTGRGCE